MADETPGGATAVAEAVTPEVPDPTPSTPETLTTPDAPAEAPDTDAPATPDTEEPEETPDEEPESPKERTVEDIEADYEANKPLTRAEIEQLARVHNDRVQLQQNLQQQTQFLQNAVPNTIKAILDEDLADLHLSPQQKEIMRTRLERRHGVFNQIGRQMFEQPLVQFAAQQLVDVLEQSGMPRQKAIDKVYDQNFQFKDYIKTAAEAVKTAGVAKPTLDSLKKNNPEIVKALEKEFHTKFPERGGNARPAGGGSTGGALTYERWMAMTPQERSKVSPEQESAMIRRQMGARR